MSTAVKPTPVQEIHSSADKHCMNEKPFKALGAN